MFALTVEKLSRYEYKPSSKEEIKAAKKKSDRKEHGRPADVIAAENSGAFRHGSPLAVRRKNRVAQLLGIGTRRGSLTSSVSSVSSLSNASSVSSG